MLKKPETQNSKHKIPKTNNGITLIALVITIIVMLILVAVTISMAINGGLFEYAGRATSETQNEIDKEGNIASGKVTVDNKVYDSIDDYLAGYPSGEPKPYDKVIKDETTGVLKENATFTDANGDTAVIPKGFVVSNVEKEQTIVNGLVITDKVDSNGNSVGNEFVWIPVEKAIVTEEEIAKIKEDDNTITTDLEAVQKMVNSGIYPMAVQVGENYKGILYAFSGTDTLILTVRDWTKPKYGVTEPTILTYWTGSSLNNIKVYDSQDKFDLYGTGTYTDTLYQESYNKMVLSVDDNKGFYVGRYEISLYTDANDSAIQYAQSKSNQTALVASSFAGYHTWFGFYKYERDYAIYNTSLGVTSEMIWGSQWDQMMIFVNGKDDGAEISAKFYVTTSGERATDDSSIKTGMNTVDQVANIFDLEASRFEFTQAGYMNYSYSANYDRASRRKLLEPCYKACCVRLATVRRLGMRTLIRLGLHFI